MNLFVSYFAKRTPLLQVAICRYPPKWFKGVNIIELAPPEEIFKKGLDKETFRRKYREYLDTLSKDFIYSLIYNVSDKFTTDVVLCCYESLKKEGEYCHRIFFMEYMNEKYGCSIREL